MSQQLYTVVQHSAYTAKGDTQFRQGLESTSITAKQAKKVRAVGGRVFDTYEEAEDFAEAEQYPTLYSGLVPIAPGTFTRHRLAQIDGRPIYIPHVERHDEDGKPYIAYFTKEPTMAHFIWNGRMDDPVQVTHGESGEPIDDTFHLAGGGAPSDLADFKRQCDLYLEREGQE